MLYFYIITLITLLFKAKILIESAIHILLSGLLFLKFYLQIYYNFYMQNLELKVLLLNITAIFVFNVINKSHEHTYGLTELQHTQYREACVPKSA